MRGVTRDLIWQNLLKGFLLIQKINVKRASISIMLKNTVSFDSFSKQISFYKKITNRCI